MRASSFTIPSESSAHLALLSRSRSVASVANFPVQEIRVLNSFLCRLSGMTTCPFSMEVCRDGRQKAIISTRPCQYLSTRTQPRNPNRRVMARSCLSCCTRESLALSRTLLPTLRTTLRITRCPSWIRRSFEATSRWSPTLSATSRRRIRRLFSTLDQLDGESR